MRQHGRSAIFALGILVAVASTGCEGVPGNFPGGTHASIDKFVYPSTTELPQTVAIVDTRTGETIWSKDIPVGRQLVIRFYAEKSEDDANPDRMDWQLMQPRQGGATLSNHVYVPPANARRIETSFRARGEMPPVASTQPEPTPAPDAPVASEPPAEAAPIPAPTPNIEPSEPPPPPEASPAPEPAADPAAPPAPADEPPVDIPDGE